MVETVVGLEDGEIVRVDLSASADNAEIAVEEDCAAGIERIHGHCAVFTEPEVAKGILDLVGWTADEDLLGKRLLEPSCGDGSFVLPAVRRLVACAKRQRRLEETALADRIVAFEFEPVTAKAARERVDGELRAAGMSAESASRLAETWVRCSDFLLAEGLGVFTHVVGNPPYMRWSKLPAVLRRAYEQKLEPIAARGDLCLSFVWRAVELLDASSGRAGLLRADRWLRCAYGAAARARLAKVARVAAHIEVHALPVFAGARKVGAYAAITVLDKRVGGGSFVSRPNSMKALLACLVSGPAPEPPKRSVTVLAAEGGAVVAAPGLAALFERMSAKGTRFADAEVRIRCGMALGVASAFVVAQDADLEVDRLVPFLRAKDLNDDGSASPVKRLIDVWTADGALVDLDRFPKVRGHLEQHKAALEKRACVVRPEVWFRTIDRLDRARLGEPKILVAGMAKASRVAWSDGGAQPSNALYAVTSSRWPLPALYAVFRAGLLDVFAEVLAPRFSGGSIRFDGNVLGQVRIPLWSSLDDGLKKAIEAMDVEAGVPCPDLIADLYGLRSSADRRALALAMARPSIPAVQP